MKSAVFTNTITNRKAVSKKLHTLIAVLLITATTFAQAPEKMSYQAVVRGASGDLVANQAVGMQISILQGSSSGTTVYVETQTPTSNVNGLVTLEIGNGTAVSGTFSAIDWGVDTYFIKTETDPAGGASYTITGTTQLTSVPYAIYATRSGSSTPGPQGTIGKSAYQVYTDNNTDPDLSETDWLASLKGEAAESLTLDATLTLGNVANAQIKDLTDPTDAKDAATKAYIDELIAGLDTRITDLETPPAIGDLRDGGIVFYMAPEPIDLDGDGTLDTGLVCTLEDQSPEIRWFNGSEVQTNASGTAIGTGSSNTDAIINIQGATETSYAAGLARAYAGGGFDDWFLPSKYELNQMYVNKATLEAVAGFTAFGSLYWSSTEYEKGSTWRQDFNNGDQTNDAKGNAHNVHAVRAF